MSQVTLHAGDSIVIPEDQERIVVHKDALLAFVKQTINEAQAYAEEAAAKIVKEADQTRQAFEDIRANRRNRNRSLTLVVAVMMTFFVPWFVSTVVQDPQILRYSTGIAIIPDSLITFYAYWRKY